MSSVLSFPLAHSAPTTLKLTSCASYSDDDHLEERVLSPDVEDLPQEASTSLSELARPFVHLRPPFFLELISRPRSFPFQVVSLQESTMFSLMLGNPSTRGESFKARLVERVWEGRSKLTDPPSFFSSDEGDLNTIVGVIQTLVSIFLEDEGDKLR